MAKSRNLEAKEPIKKMKLLFICTHNRCRSILAEAISNHVANPHIRAASAGSSPEGVVHPLSLYYLSERGVSTQGLQSESWHDYENYHPDAVITLCESAAQEVCPVWFGNTVQAHWGLDDPSKNEDNENAHAAAFKGTIDILERRIRSLLDMLSTSENKVLNSQQLETALAQLAVEIN